MDDEIDFSITLVVFCDDDDMFRVMVDATTPGFHGSRGTFSFAYSRPFEKEEDAQSAMYAWKDDLEDKLRDLVASYQEG